MSFRSFFTSESAVESYTSMHSMTGKGVTDSMPDTFYVSKMGPITSRLLALSVLAMSITACNTIPKADMRPVLAEPNIPIEQAYGAFGDETVSSANQASLASQRWQDFYSDERLKGLIALGLEKTKTLKVRA